MILTEAELIDELRQEAALAGGVRAWCRRRNIAPGNVSAVLAGTRRVYPALVKAMGAETRFVLPGLRP